MSEGLVAIRAVVDTRAQTGERGVEEVGIDLGEANASVRARTRHARVRILAGWAEVSGDARARERQGSVCTRSAVFARTILTAIWKFYPFGESKNS